MNKKVLILMLFLGSLLVFLMLDFGYTPEGEMREGTRTLASGLGWVYLIVCVGAAFVVPLLQQRGTRQALRILNEECDPARYIASCQRECAKPKHKEMRLVWESNLAMGYHAAGETERASAMLREIRQKAPRLNKRMQWILRANQTDLLLDMGDLEHGGALYNQTFKERVPGHGDTQDLQTRMYGKILALQGEHQQAVDVLLPLTGRGTMYMRCSVYSQLAEEYRHLGMEEQRRECLDFVATNGGGLAIAEKARLELGVR